jgi:hypothetical protein
MVILNFLLFVLLPPKLEYLRDFRRLQFEQEQQLKLTGQPRLKLAGPPKPVNIKNNRRT